MKGSTDLNNYLNKCKHNSLPLTLYPHSNACNYLFRWLPLLLICMGHGLPDWRIRENLDQLTHQWLHLVVDLPQRSPFLPFIPSRFKHYSIFMCCCPCKRQETQNMPSLLAFIAVSSFSVYGYCLTSGFPFTLTWTISRV